MPKTGLTDMAALMGEAELWQRRVSALQSGDLRVARILATAAQ